MSQTIENRIVEMQFENQQFESGVQESLSTLDKLKKALKFDDASKNLTDFSKQATKNIDLSHVQDSVDTLSNKFSTLRLVGIHALNNIVDSAMAAGKRMVDALTAPMQQIKSGGWSRAMNIEDAKFQLEGLGIAWESVYQNIDDAVSGTAYSLDAAAKACSQLSASGVQAGDDMAKALRAISGVAAMGNTEYENIADIFTKAAGNGKVMADELNRISAYGLNARATMKDFYNDIIDGNERVADVPEHIKENVKALTKGLKVTEGDISDFASKSKIDFETFYRAMDLAFGEHAKKANDTFTGALRNIKSALSRTGQKFAEPLIKDAIPVLNKVRELVNAINSKLGPFANAFANITRMISNALIDKLSTAIDFITNKSTVSIHIFHTFRNIAEALIRIFVTLGDAFRAVFPKTKEYGSGIQSLAEGMEKLSEKLIPSNSALNIFRTIMIGVFNVIKLVGNAIKFVLPIVTNVLAVGMKVVSVIANIISALINMVSQMSIVRTVMDAIRNSGGLFALLMDKLKAAFTYLRNVMSDTSTVTGRFAAKMKEAIGTIVYVVVGVLYTAFTKIREFITGMISSGDPLGFIINSFKNLVQHLKLIPSLIKQFGIPEKLMSGLGFVLEKVGFGVSKVIDLFKALGGAIKSAFGIFSEDKVIEESVEMPIAHATNSMSGFVTELTKTQDGVKKVTAETSTGMGELGNKTKETGGILDRVKGIFGGLVGILGSLWTSIKSGLTDIKLSHVLLTAFAGVLVLTAWHASELMKALAGLARKLSGGFFNIFKRGKTTFQKFKEGLIMISGAIALLAGSIFMLKDVPVDKLKEITAALMKLVGLVGLLSILSSIVTNLTGRYGGGGAFNAFSASMLSFSAGLAVLVGALYMLQKLPMDGIWSKIGVLALIMAALAGVSIAMAKFAPQLSMGGLSMVAFALSALLLVKALAKLKDVPLDAIKENWLELSGVIVAFGIFAAAAAKVGITSVLGIAAFLLAFKYLFNHMDDIKAMMDKYKIGEAIANVISKIRDGIANAVKYLIDTYKSLSAWEKYCLMISTKWVAIGGAILAWKLEGINKSFRKVLSGMAIFALSVAGLLLVVNQVAKQAASLPEGAVSKTVQMLAAVGIVLAAIAGISALGSGDTTFNKKGKNLKESSSTKRSDFLKQARKMLFDMAILLAAMALFMNVVGGLTPEEFSRASKLLIGVTVIMGAIMIVIALISKSVSKTKDASSIIGPLIAIMALMGVLLGAFVVLMNYFKDFKMENLKELILTIGVLVLAVWAINSFLKRLSEIKGKGTGMALGGIAAIIVALGGVVALLVSTIKEEDLGRAGIIAAGLMAALAAVIGLAWWASHVLKGSTKQFKNITKIMITMVGSLVAIGLIIMGMTKALSGDLWSAVGVTAILMGSLAAVIGLTQWLLHVITKNNVTKAKTSQMRNIIITMVGALVAIAITITAMTKVLSGEGDLKSAVAVAAILMGSLAAIIGLTQWLLHIMLKNSVTKTKLSQMRSIMITMVGALVAIAITITAMTKVLSGEGDLKSAVAVAGILLGALAALEGLIALLVYIMKKTDWGTLGKSGAAMAGMVAAFAFIAYVIHKVVELNDGALEMIKKSGVILGVLLALEILIVTLMGIGKAIEGSNLGALFGGLALTAMIALFWWLEYVFSQIDKFNTSAGQLLGKSQTIILVMLELEALFIVCMTIGNIMIGSGGLLALAAALGLVALGAMIYLFDMLAEAFAKIDKLKTEGIMAKSQTLILVMFELELLGLASIACIGAYIGGFGLELMIDYFGQLAEAFTKLDAINPDGMMSKSHTLTLVMGELELLGLASIACIGVYIGGKGLEAMIRHFGELAEVFKIIDEIKGDGMAIKAQILTTTMLELELLGLASIACVGAYIGGEGLGVMVDYFGELAKVFIELDKIQAPETLPAKVDIITDTLLELEGLGALSFIDVLASIGDEGLGSMVQFFSDISDVMGRISVMPIDETTSVKAQYVMDVLDEINSASWGTLGGVIAGFGAGGISEMIPIFSSLIDVASKINSSGITSMDSEAVGEAFDTLIDALDDLADVDGGDDSVAILIAGLAKLATLSGSSNGILLLAESIEKLSEVSNSIGATADRIANAIESIIARMIGILDGAQTRMYEASKQLMLKMGAGIESVDSSAWGAHLVENFAAGISSRQGVVESAIANIAQICRDYIGHTEPKTGPLAGGEEIFGIDLDENFAKGIIGGEGKVTSAISDMANKGKEILSGIGTSAKDMGASAASWFTEKFKNIVPGAASSAGAVEDIINGLMNKLFGVEAELASISSAWSKGYGTLADYQYQLKTEIGTQKREVSQLTERYERLKKAGSSSAETIKTKLDATNTNLKSTQERLQNIGKASKDVDKVTESLDNLAGTGGKGGGGAKGAAEEVKNFADELENVLEGQLNIFQKFEKKEAMSKEELLENMRSQIRGMTEWAANMQSLAAKGLDEGLYQELAMMGPQGAEYVGAFAQMTAEELAEANNLWAQSLVLPKNVANQVAGSFNSIGKNLMAGEAAGIVAGKTEAITEAVNAQNEITSSSAAAVGVQSPSTVFAEIGKFLMQGLANGIKAHGGEAVTQVKKICSDIISSAKSSLSSSKFYSIGVNLLNGLTAGLKDKDALKALKSRLLELAKMMETEEKEDNKVKSPSRLWRDEIGRYLVLGLAEGLRMYAGEAVKAVDYLSDTTFDAMKDTISGIGQMLVDEVDDPVITPVLDLSNVQSGVKTLNNMFSTSQALQASASLNSNLQNEQLNGQRLGTTFIQNNYSPKALSRTEIYRQTKNQFSAYREAFS